MVRLVLIVTLLMVLGCSSDYYKAAFEGDVDAFCRSTYRSSDYHREQHERLLAIVSAMTDADLSRRASKIEPRSRDLPKTGSPGSPPDKVALVYYVSYEYGRRETEALPVGVEYTARVSLIGKYLYYAQNYRILAGRLGGATPHNRVYCPTYLTDLATAVADVWECKAGVGSCPSRTN